MAPLRPCICWISRYHLRTLHDRPLPLYREIGRQKAEYMVCTLYRVCKSARRSVSSSLRVYCRERDMAPFLGRPQGVEAMVNYPMANDLLGRVTNTVAQRGGAANPWTECDLGHGRARVRKMCIGVKGAVRCIHCHFAPSHVSGFEHLWWQQADDLFVHLF